MIKNGLIFEKIGIITSLGDAKNANFADMILFDRCHRYTRTVLMSFLLLAVGSPVHAGYVDHRGHNVDSLEAVLAAHPSLDDEVNTRIQLMNAYLVKDMEKSLMHARTIIRLTENTDSYVSCCDAFRIIGQHFYSNELYDSASCYYARALAKAERIPYVEGSIEPDNMLSVLYGTLGNLMNIQDSVRKAEEYYLRAASIFESRHWNEPMSILLFNMGEMYVSMDDSAFQALGYEGSAAEYAMDIYRRGKEVALLTEDSFFVAGHMYGIAKSMYYCGDCEAALPLNTEVLEYLSRHKDDDYQTYRDALLLQSNLLVRMGDLSGADKVQKVIDREEKKEKRERYQEILCAGENDEQRAGTPLKPVLLVIIGSLAVVSAALLVSLRRKKNTPAGDVQRSSDSVQSSSMPVQPELSATQLELPQEPAGSSASALPEMNAEGKTETQMESDDDVLAVCSDDLELSERELMVLRLLSQGKTTPQIAEATYRSADTIRWYRKRLLQKFGVHNTAALIKAASERGLL